MLHSMTGFARQTAESSLGTLTCELRTVNHRFLDVQFRLPEELRPRETDLRQQVSACLKRGKIDCTVHYRRGSGGSVELRLNEDLVRQLGALTKDLSGLLPETAALNPLDVLRWPGVIVETEFDSEPLFEEMRKLLDATLQALSGMRRSEGTRILKMLETRCAEVLAVAAGVRRRMPEVLQTIRNKQQERIARLNVDADPARLETELALIAQKLDVDEEIDRLESHISEIREILAGDGPVGRRLDFLMQELNRETNTLGSKSADTETTKAAVELKVLIEQMREQVQNIE